VGRTVVVRRIKFVLSLILWTSQTLATFSTSHSKNILEIYIERACLFALYLVSYFIKEMCILNDFNLFWRSYYRMQFLSTLNISDAISEFRTVAILCKYVEGLNHHHVLKCKFWGSRSVRLELICLLLRYNFMQYVESQPTFQRNCRLHICLLPASCWILAWIILEIWRRRWHILPKRPLTFYGLRGVISHKSAFHVSKVALMCLVRFGVKPIPKECFLLLDVFYVTTDRTTAACRRS
jgi:hypothetical protein